MWHYKQKNASYLDVSLFTGLHVSFRALDAFDIHNVLRDSNVGRGSGVGSTATDAACQWRVASAPTMIAPFFAVMKSLNVRRICLHLCGVLMGSCYLN